MSMTPPEGCPFCRRIAANEDLLLTGDLFAAFYDTTPLNPGHVLIVPRRHEQDYFSLSIAEHSAILGAAVALHTTLQAQFRPDGFNVGVNVGAAAGQTIGHVHLHLIPRFQGDVADPRGGIRWMIPDRARYWSEADQEPAR